jgi:hypothetical protein
MHNSTPLPVITGLKLEHPLCNKPAYGIFLFHEVSQDYVTQLIRTLVYIFTGNIGFNIMQSGFTILA